MMMIAIQVSLYPLEQEDINRSLEVFWDVLKENGIDYRITPLSTVTWGEDEDLLYNTIYKAYKEARKEGPAVMVTTLVSAHKDRVSELLDYLKM
jgi:uncharacterized protein YqgV (UPF0045/DUF77 family)